MVWLQGADDHQNGYQQHTVEGRGREAQMLVVGMVVSASSDANTVRL